MDWQDTREGKMTDAQRRMLNAAAGDLAEQVNWHGHHMSKADWRHWASAVVLGLRQVPGYDRGEGSQGFILLGRSSLELSRKQASEVIEILFHIGDAPHDQGLKSPPVRWSKAVCLGRFITEDA